MRKLIVANVLAALAAVPAAAQDIRIHADLFGQNRPAAPKPPAVNWNAPATNPAAPAEPKVVCGMTVIPADPKIDPKMRVAPPDTGVKYTLKVVPPTVCKP